MHADTLEELLKQASKHSLEKEMLLGLEKNDQDLLLLAAELKTIPVIAPPVAIMRKKYAEQKTGVPFFRNSFWVSYKFTTVLAGLVLMLLGGFSYTTANSLPGQKLFSVKKSAEQFRIKFASGDAQRAYLQVQIAKKRVNEAEKLVALGNSDPELALVALKEVAQATETASKEVETLTPKDIKNSENPLLSALEDVSRKEKNLVSNISSSEETQNKQDVIAMSLKNQSRISEIIQAVETATAEEAITTLTANPNTVLVSGQITLVGKDSVTVEKTLFLLGLNTEILSQAGEKLTINELKAKAKAAVSGKKLDNKLIAEKITVFDTEILEPEAEVKGETTASSTTSTTTESIIQPQTPVSDGEKTQETNPNQAVGSFIYEDPSPQYAP